MRFEKTLVTKTLLAAVAALMLAGPASAGQPKKGPVKVFIMAGQSNMDGQAQVSTIDFLSEDPDPQRAALLKVFKPDGKNLVTRDDVWVANPGVYDKLQPGFGGRKNYDKLGTKIGPEYTFGYYMGEALENQVLLIKYGPGGTSLSVAWRPPSAGPTGDAKLDAQEVSQEVADKWFRGRKGKVYGCQYRLLLDIVQDTLDNLKKRFPDYDEKAGYEICGFVWFQGYNDLGCTQESYAHNLTCLIKDLRKDLKTPEMKVVVGVMGVNGVKNEGGKQKALRGAQRSMNSVPEFQGKVKAIETAPLLDSRVVELRTAGWLNDRDTKKNPITEEEWALLRRATSDKGFHYNGEGRFFILLGKAFADTMLELMGEGSKVVPPNLNAFTPPSSPPT